MGKRTTARRLAMQAIYQAELSGVNVEEALKNIVESENVVPVSVSFAKELCSAAWEAKDESDKVIKRLAIGWPLDRIGKVDRAILRLSLFELDQKETPTSVVINEAVELAKKYSTPEAAKFINGILGSYIRDKA